MIVQRSEWVSLTGFAGIEAEPVGNDLDARERAGGRTWLVRFAKRAKTGEPPLTCFYSQEALSLAAYFHTTMNEFIFKYLCCLSFFCEAGKSQVKKCCKYRSKGIGRFYG